MNDTSDNPAVNLATRFLSVTVHRLTLLQFNVSSLMDYIAGAAPTPLRRQGPLGLEQLFRLLSDPARLWERYLVEPWCVLGVFFTERVGRTRANGG